MAHIQLQPISNAGPAIIFIHGFLGDSTQWEPIINKLKFAFSLFTIDLPGHGSNDSLQFYTMDDLAMNLAQEMQKQDIITAHVVGHSMGGYLGSAFAKAYPEKISSLTLINSIAGVDSEERFKLRNRSLEFIERYGHAYTSMAISNLFTDIEKVTNTAMIEDLKNSATRMNLKAIKNAIIAMRDRLDATEELLFNDLSVHYIAGTQDTILPIGQIENEANQLKKNISKIDTGHMSILTSPDLVVDKLPFIE